VFKETDLSKLKLIITVGISASGKTTWVDDFLYGKDSSSWVNINRDDIRFNFLSYADGWDTYKFTKAKENEVSNVEMQQFNEAVEYGKNIIISNTNLNPKIRNKWVKLGEDNGYVVEIKSFDISLEAAYKRDQFRGKFSVGRDVLNRQWKQWLEFSGSYKYVRNTKLPKAIVVDVDGTVAIKGDRSPFDWSKVGQDTPRGFITLLLLSYLKQWESDSVIFLSGRDSACRHQTLTWLSKHLHIPIYNINLFMRKEGDMRKDSIIKLELFKDHIANNYDVLAVFDDRPQVVDMWYDIGIENVICVADQRIKF